MNKLPAAKRAQILHLLCEGSFMRPISRVASASINTVTELLGDAGEACLAMHDELVRDVKANRIQCDEIWSFCYAKERNVASAKAATDGAGRVWTWTALDANTKLMVANLSATAPASPPSTLMDDLSPALEQPGAANDGRAQGVPGGG